MSSLHQLDQYIKSNNYLLEESNTSKKSTKKNQQSSFLEQSSISSQLDNSTVIINKSIPYDRPITVVDSDLDTYLTVLESKRLIRRNQLKQLYNSLRIDDEDGKMDHINPSMTLIDDIQLQSNNEINMKLKLQSIMQNSGVAFDEISKDYNRDSFSLNNQSNSQIFMSPISKDKIEKKSKQKSPLKSPENNQNSESKADLFQRLRQLRQLIDENQSTTVSVNENASF